jgi:hypothetical protein
MIAFALIILFGGKIGLTGLRTILANGLIVFGGVLSAVLAFLTEFQWGTIFREHPEYAAWAVLLFGVGNIVLRVLTTGPVGRG